MKKRIISMILVLSIIMSTIPTSTFAANAKDNQASQTSSQENPFIDIKSSDWFYSASMYVLEHGIFNGTDTNKFSPSDTMTRAMYVAVLGRIAGIDIKKYSDNGNFSDVKPGTYYAPYVAWAVEKNIAKGTNYDTFEPDKLVTREQSAAFTVRFFTAYDIKYPEAHVTTTPADLDSVSPYAREAVLKLWSTGFLKGDAAGKFNAMEHTTRAEAAAFCMRVDGWEKDRILPGEPIKPVDPETKKTIEDDFISRPKVQYDVNGGLELKPTIYKMGDSLDNLSTPYKAGTIFEGWYYDKELTNRVLQSDVFKQSITVYAKYGDTPVLNEMENPQFAVKMDQAPNFTIKVRVASGATMTLQNVKDGIIAKNLNSVTQTEIIKITQESDVFIISAITDKFEEGASYKITLDDDRLLFDGHSQSVRDYNFAIAKEETLNLSLNKDIKYILMTDVSNITKDGAAVEQLSIPVIAINVDTGLSGVNLSKGDFEYDKAPLAVGDTIALYEGVVPNERKLNDTRDGADAEIAYMTITQVSGKKYSYKNADAKDIMFTPDVLPISVDADTDGKTDNKSITVDKTVLDYSADKYTEMGLDSQTTVDVGDYIAFYIGDFGSVDAQDKGYAHIKSITAQNDLVIITYDIATEAEILSSMDIYDQKDVSGETLLENVDIEQLEENIAEQASTSGFADQAAQYLADAALETQSFTTMSQDMQLRSMSVRKQDGSKLKTNEIAQMKSSMPRVIIKKMNAEIGTKLQHFNVSGVRVVLEVEIEVQVDINDGAQIIINVTGKFEQEARISLRISGGSVWRGLRLIDWEVTAAIDLYNYTGIKIDATIVTKEKDSSINGKFKNIGQELKKLIETNNGNIGDGKGTIAEGLSDKYKEMLENESDWVQLFDKDIVRTKGTIDPFNILAYNIGLTFVVSANMNISLGCDFYYENAKRYIYSIGVFKQTVTSDTIDIVEEKYEFTFYIMGELGLRAGVRAEFAVGVFSTDLASIGFSAEAGAYVRVWGYFYYNIKYTASNGRNSNYAGALLFELGIYLEIKFKAQAGAETFCYNPTLYANEWPLWTAGVQRNVQNFSYLIEEAPEISLKRFMKNMIIPDEVFKMHYMDLKIGNTDNAVYDDSKDFTIEITNKAFKYDLASNILTVDPGEQIKCDGQMIITWRNAPLVFTSAPLRRVINLHWDNLNDGYYIAFNPNGGSIVNMIIKPYEGAIQAPQPPTRLGYTFGGWFTDEQFSNPYTIPATMPASDIVVFAKWTANTNTPYTVAHYKQNLQNTLYTLDGDVVNMQGTTDTNVVPSVNTYKGFSSPAQQELLVRADGSAELRYYYPRTKYQLTFNPGIAGGDSFVSQQRYGSTITAPSMAAKGYIFDGWDKDIEATMPAADVIYTATWKVKVDETNYRVEQYYQNTKGDGYAFISSENHIGTTDAIVNPETFKLTMLPTGITYKNATVLGEPTTSTKISADGKLVIKLNYDREVHDLKFELNVLAEEDMPITMQYRYDAIIDEPTIPGTEGYNFMGWYTDALYQNKVAFGTLKMQKIDITLYGKMELNPDASFSIVYNNLKNATNTENPTTYKVEDADISLSDPGEIKGYTFDGWYTDALYQNKVVAVAIPHESVGRKKFYAKWNINNYDITYNNMTNASSSNPETYNIENNNISLSPATKDGYTFKGWFADDALQSEIAGVAIEAGSIGAKTFYAKWEANKYTVKFDANKGIGVAIADQEFIYDEEQILNENYFSRVHYEFTGWRVGSTGAIYKAGVPVKNIATDGEVILYAQWKAIEYTITYNLNSGTNDSKNPAKYTVETNTQTIHPATKTSNRFDGWFDNSNFTGSAISNIAGRTANMTLYAKWTEVEYRIVFMPSGDNISGTMPSMEKQIQGVPVKLTQNLYKRTGHDFLGWAKTQNATTKEYSNEEEKDWSTEMNTTTKQLTLYPVWKVGTYTVIYDGRLYAGKKLATMGNVSGNGYIRLPFNGDFWKKLNSTANEFEYKYDEVVPLKGEDVGVKGWMINKTEFGTLEDGFIKIGDPNAKGLDEGRVWLVPVWNDGESGKTQENPYLIHNREGLEIMRQHPDWYFKLITNVLSSDNRDTNTYTNKDAFWKEEFPLFNNSTNAKKTFIWGQLKLSDGTFGDFTIFKNWVG